MIPQTPRASKTVAVALSKTQTLSLLRSTLTSVVWLAVDHARRAPLAIVGVGSTSVRSRVDDDAVVAVPVGNVDASQCAGDRIRLRIHGHVRRFVQQSVTGVGVGSLGT